MIAAAPSGGHSGLLNILPTMECLTPEYMHHFLELRVTNWLPIVLQTYRAVFTAKAILSSHFVWTRP